MIRWISIHEKLPPVGMRVPIWQANYAGQDVTSFDSGFLVENPKTMEKSWMIENCGWDGDSAEADAGDVTHWLELELPEGLFAVHAEEV